MYPIAWPAQDIRKFDYFWKIIHIKGGSPIREIFVTIVFPVSSAVLMRVMKKERSAMRNFWVAYSLSQKMAVEDSKIQKFFISSTFQGRYFQLACRLEMRLFAKRHYIYVQSNQKVGQMSFYLIFCWHWRIFDIVSSKTNCLGKKKL